MTYEFRLVKGPRGRRRRLVIDPDAPPWEPRSPTDPWATVPPGTIAFWDLTRDDTTVRVTYVTVRPDLRGTGVLSSLVPHMKRLLDGRTLDAPTIIDSAVESVTDAIRAKGVTVNTTVLTGVGLKGLDALANE